PRGRELPHPLPLHRADQGRGADQIVLTIGYDIENLSTPERRKAYKGEITTDHYGRRVPKQAHGSINLGSQTASTRLITNAAMELFDRIVDHSLLVRRMYVVANHVVSENDLKAPEPEQLDLFTDYAALEQQREEERLKLEKEKKGQKAILESQKKYGKNALLKGMNLDEGATGKDRNTQIGGHRK
ncbi:MAG: DNA methylase, partial [Lachnospiraceae bacterium]|nr:DNA methylase [Lachnospiraceae bacterium]